MVSFGLAAFAREADAAATAELTRNVLLSMADLLYTRNEGAAGLTLVSYFEDTTSSSSELSVTIARWRAGFVERDFMDSSVRG